MMVFGKMASISSPPREAFLLSPRTMKYIAALFREGDKFDYCKWLKRVREEETQAKQRPVASAPFEPAAPGIGTETGTSDAFQAKDGAGDESHAIPESILASSARAQKQNATNWHSAVA
jgi:hypothetical protein